MLNQIFSLYIESLIYTTIAVGIVDGLWIGLRMIRRKDKTAKERQSHLYDVLLIAIMTIPVLSFAVLGLLIVFKA
ncbi:MULTISPECIES: DUF4059 family protein [Streptococcus]|uniref:Amino acid transporter, AAT family n=1 Tax=Streptococcus sinensis TaxID=176090 RepID=A0A0A0DIM3_9STRE|nr:MULTISPECIES: DUF4059 family protein [Streptococcus]KGM37733.1 hypothetical protein SSIN_0454 [Streptococcus sinensis]KXT63013.1 hypothetical protein STRDD04_01943 [Streptococcus sp. DD04]MCY7217445.1 DUF4059 family protein [Streptococcus cristatus]